MKRRETERRSEQVDGCHQSSRRDVLILLAAQRHDITMSNTKRHAGASLHCDVHAVEQVGADVGYSKYMQLRAQYTENEVNN